MQSPADLLLPALLFTVIGIVIGVVAVLIITDRTRARPDEKSSSGEPASPPPSMTEVPGLPSDRFDAAAKLYRERATGRLAIEVDQKVYLTPDSLPAPVRQELMTLHEGMAAWLRASAEPAPPPLRTEPPPMPAGPPPAPPAKTEAPAATSFVSQINDVLQEILAESPMADRKIALTQEPSMGVIVWVDGAKYSGIDTVPDPAVKELIQAAVRKWERKNDLGRRYS
jgi:hypothetical protein